MRFVKQNVAGEKVEGRSGWRQRQKVARDKRGAKDADRAAIAAERAKLYAAQTGETPAAPVQAPPPKPAKQKPGKPAPDADRVEGE